MRFAGNAQLMDNQCNSRGLKMSHLNLFWPDISHAILKHFEIIYSKYLITVVCIVCFDPVPSRLCLEIYYQGDEKYPCLGNRVNKTSNNGHAYRHKERVRALYWLVKYWAGSLLLSSILVSATDYGCPVRKLPSLNGQKSIPIPNL